MVKEYRQVQLVKRDQGQVELMKEDLDWGSWSGSADSARSNESWSKSSDRNSSGSHNFLLDEGKSLKKKNIDVFSNFTRK